MFNLNNTSRLPIYQQIQDQVLGYIACGLLQPLQQLPGVRQLAKDLGINPNTVMKAYTELERDGYIYSVQGKGSYVSEPNLEQPNLKLDKLAELEKTLRSSKDYGVTQEDVVRLLYEIYPKEGKV